MSLLGHQRRLGSQPIISGMPKKADHFSARCHFALRPDGDIADVKQAAN
jgi:hypothetical protein